MADEQLGRLLINVAIQDEGTTKALDDVAQASTRLKKQADPAQQSTKDLGASITSIKLPAVQAMGVVNTLASSIGMLGAAAASFAGVRLAAQYERIEIGFKSILGSAQAAHKIMRELRQMGTETPYRTEALIGYARGLTAVTHNGDEAVKMLRTLAAVGSAQGWGEGDIGEVVKTLAALGSTPNPMGSQTIMSLSSKGIDIARVAKAAGLGDFGTGPYATARASMAFGALQGPRAMELLIKGMEKIYPATMSFLGVIQNLGESLAQIMLPTGQMLIPVLGAIARAVTWAAQRLHDLNEYLGGTAGFAFIVSGLVRFGPALIASLQGAFVGIMRLTTALQALAVTSNAAAMSVGGAAATNTGSAAGATLTWGALGKGGLNALKGALGGGLRGLLMGIIRTILPIGMVMGGAALASDRPGAGYSALNVLARGLEGAGFGLLAKNGWATALGAIAGIAYGIWENYQPKPEDDAAKQTAENTKRMADGMDQLRMQVIGGGIRTRRGASDIEAQINLSRAMATLSGV
jgi:hypothetical protein